MTEVDTVAKGEGRKERKEDCEISIRLPLEGLDTHTHNTCRKRFCLPDSHAVNNDKSVDEKIPVSARLISSSSSVVFSLCVIHIPRSWWRYFWTSKKPAKRPILTNNGLWLLTLVERSHRNRFSSVHSCFQLKLLFIICPGRVYLHAMCYCWNIEKVILLLSLFRFSSLFKRFVPKVSLKELINCNCSVFSFSFFLLF